MKLTLKQDPKALLRHAIQRVAVGPNRGHDLTREQCRELGRMLLEPGFDEVQAAVLLIALRMKGETLDELQGLLDAFNENLWQGDARTDALPRVPELVCVAEPFDGYSRHVPVSPFLPAVLAACEVPALMIGVHSVGPKHGLTPHKIYRQAGIDIDLRAPDVAQLIESVGWGYLDQASYASSLNRLAGLRDRIVKRTALTTLERLLMPMRGQQATHLVLGYVHRAYPDIYAALAGQAGYSSVLLTKGIEGGVTPAPNKPLRSELSCFSDVDSEPRSRQSISLGKGLDMSESLPPVSDGSMDIRISQCLDQGQAVLMGLPGPARDTLCLAAAQILLAYGRFDSFTAAVVKVQNSLDNGSANASFDALVRASAA
ncbi:MAG: anthranilate phosphoribosyltransferase [Gammaproteobacteria bacterium]|nr:anthranilate phosphoribosyltransferase [Gammaproteobacteria bacterium]